MCYVYAYAYVSVDVDVYVYVWFGSARCVVLFRVGVGCVASRLLVSYSAVLCGVRKVCDVCCGVFFFVNREVTASLREIKK